MDICPASIDDTHEQESPGEQESLEELGLSIRLDRPFHELKEHLVSKFERAYLARCLAASEMNLSAASRSSGISRKHLRTLMTKYGLDRRLGLELERELDEDSPSTPSPLSL